MESGESLEFKDAHRLDLNLFDMPYLFTYFLGDKDSVFLHKVFRLQPVTQALLLFFFEFLYPENVGKISET